MLLALGATLSVTLPHKQRGVDSLSLDQISLILNYAKFRSKFEVRTGVTVLTECQRNTLWQSDTLILNAQCSICILNLTGNYMRRY